MQVPVPPLNWPALVRGRYRDWGFNLGFAETVDSPAREGLDLDTRGFGIWVKCRSGSRPGNTQGLSPRRGISSRMPNAIGGNWTVRGPVFASARWISRASRLLIGAPIRRRSAL